MPGPVHRKRALRAELRERRHNMSAHERELAAIGITTNLEALSIDLSARSLACYLSTLTEPNTRPFVDWARSQGIRVLLPVARDDGLLDWTASQDGAERIGVAGVPEPVGELLGPIAINAVDVIVVPAAAVDAGGMRLGSGRGYFDKTLGSMEKSPPVFAVVFDGEVVDFVPREVHDQSVDGVVTPTRTMTFD